MARKGDGIFKHGSMWRLDCHINGIRYQLPLGKGSNRTAAGDKLVERMKTVDGYFGSLKG
jgi:hypothetical protein